MFMNKFRGFESHRGDAVIFSKKKVAIFGGSRTLEPHISKTGLSILPKFRLPPLYRPCSIILPSFRALGYAVFAEDLVVLVRAYIRSTSHTILSEWCELWCSPAGASPPHGSFFLPFGLHFATMSREHMPRHQCACIKMKKISATPPKKNKNAQHLPFY